MTITYRQSVLDYYFLHSDANKRSPAQRIPSADILVIQPIPMLFNLLFSFCLSSGLGAFVVSFRSGEFQALRTVQFALRHSIFGLIYSLIEIKQL